VTINILAAIALYSAIVQTGILFALAKIVARDRP